MNIRKVLCSLFIVAGFGISAKAQLVCPPNIDFELGDLTGWSFFTGSYGAAETVPDATIPGAAIACRHTLTKVTGLIGCTGPGGVGPLDQYGGFPVVAPGGGSYSLRVGANVTGGLTEKARFYVHIPPGSDNYSLIYRYAVVMQNPNHTPDYTQPQFLVRVFDSAATAAGGGVIPVLIGDTACSYFRYMAGTALPGYMSNTSCPTCSPTATAGTPVLYKSWSTATIDLSGLSGTTVGIDFISSDCRPTGHFCYGYIDMNCGLFKIAATVCDTSVPPVLTAPDGFASYTWWDSATFSVLYGTGMSVTIAYPTGPTTIAVVLEPFPGYGCPDTLYTTIRPAALALNPSPDTAICRGRNVNLIVDATDIATPLTYSWAPALGLSCTTCPMPVASPSVSTIYTVTVTNTNGCILEHPFDIEILPDLITTVTNDTPSCHNDSNATASVAVSNGLRPYYYTWSTTPVSLDSFATGLWADTFTVIVIDSLGCTDTNEAIIWNPDARVISVDTFFHPLTCLGANGNIVFEGYLLPDSTYTLSYLFDGVPQTRVVVADASGKVTLFGLTAGAYTNITVIGSACAYNITGPVILVDPPIPDLTGVTSNSFVCVGDTLKLFATSTTPGVTWSWVGPAGFSSILNNPEIAPASMAMAGVYSVTVSRNDCYNYASVLVEIRPLPVPLAGSNTPVCSNDTLFLTSSSSSGATSYIWNGPNFFNSYSQNPYIAHVQTVSAGVYTVAITLNGCTVPDTIDITINQTPMAPVVRDTNYCQNDVAVGYYAEGSNLTWYATATNGTGVTTVPVPSTIKSGIYPYYVTQTSDEGCTSSRSQVSARVWTYPNLHLSLTDSVTCGGKYITFMVENVQEGNTGFAWHFESVDSIKNMNPIYHAFNTVGVHTVAASAYYMYCPTIELSRVVSVFPYPTMDLGRDTSICPGSKSIQLSAAQVNTFGYPATWKWGTGETTPKITIVSPGTYRATVTVNGCESSDTIKVVNDCYINIPNIFTPNGDGVNDYFFPRQLLTSGLINFDMNIYNRWGQLIFSANSLDGRGWDGMFNGKQQPEGVYIYTINAEFKDGQIEQHKGNVTLLR